jgi:hypothetical protein
MNADVAELADAGIQLEGAELHSPHWSSPRVASLACSS